MSLETVIDINDIGCYIYYPLYLEYQHITEMLLSATI
jgi:hypothetical protein